MQLFLFNIRPKVHRRKWRKLRVARVPNFLNFTSSLLMLLFVQP